MGTLINLNTIGPAAVWYFDDAYFVDSQTCKFEWPSLQFPHMVSIHRDTIIEDGTRAKIRRWVCAFSTDAVIYDIADRSYRLYHSKSREFGRSHAVSNEWYRFWFADSETALAFSLRFSDIISPVTDTHPTRHYEPTQ